MYLTRLKEVIIANRFYYGTFAIIWLLGCIIQFTFSQFDISLAINGLYSFPADFLMEYTTYAGDGIFLLLVGIVLVAINRKLWLVTLLCLAIPSVVTQLLKHYVFADNHRPIILMANIPELHYLKGVAMNQFNSFPSGHTTAAFSLYTLLALVFKGKRAGWVWCIIATLIALSRVYLLQHFWADIMAGSMLAVLLVTFIYTFFAAKLRADETISK